MCMVYNINSCSRDATSSSIMAYLVPGLHLHFYFSAPLPDIVIICSLLHDFYVLMDSSVSFLNSSLNLNWSSGYLDLIAKGCQGVCLWDILGIWKSDIGKHGSFGEIKDNGGHGEECGKTRLRR